MAYKCHPSRGWASKIVGYEKTFFFSLTFAIATYAASADVEYYHITPTNLDTPVSIKVAADQIGERFVVFYKTNSTTLDKFLDGRLYVCSEDQQIASSSLKKDWKENGVEFEFSVAPKYLAASTFTIAELGHDHDQPMGGADCYWFYLRDFATNSLKAAGRTNSSGLAPDIIKSLPEIVRSLRPGMTADEVWEKLFHKPYRQISFGGVGYPDYERWWLAWNYEGEFYFQSPPPGRSNFPQGKRILIRANLYKNGVEISRSGK